MINNCLATGWIPLLASFTRVGCEAGALAEELGISKVASKGYMGESTEAVSLGTRRLKPPPAREF